MPEPTAHLDTFAGDRLPPREDWPLLDLTGVPELRYPPRLNAAAELLDRRAGDRPDAPAYWFEGRAVSYRELLAMANRLANLLVHELGVVPGSRVLIRGANHPMVAAGVLATWKAGAIGVPTMPLLRARELGYILDKARVNAAICDRRLADELSAALDRSTVRDTVPSRGLAFYNYEGPDSLEPRMAACSDRFANVDTSAEDVALIAFTSGTTGLAKGTLHFHRDLLATCDTYSRYVLQPGSDDIFCGTPPLAFTFGLGGLLLFPLHAGAATALVERPSPEALLQTIQNRRATVCFTAPTMYRAMLEHLDRYDIRSLRTCVSAGETLPLPTFDAWQRATGLKIMDGIGATEMLHIFIGSAGDQIRPGATGRVVPGYRAQVVDEQGHPLPPGQIGRLAVRATWTTPSASAATSKTAGTTPATPTSWTRMAISGTRPAPTT
jgi:2-aminobenzoate-CoA ligase